MKGGRSFSDHTPIEGIFRAFNQRTDATARSRLKLPRAGQTTRSASDDVSNYEF